MRLHPCRTERSDSAGVPHVRVSRLLFPDEQLMRLMKFPRPHTVPTAPSGVHGLTGPRAFHRRRGGQGRGDHGRGYNT
jgi:hypothetical protein